MDPLSANFPLIGIRNTKMPLSEEEGQVGDIFCNFILLAQGSIFRLYSAI